MQVPRKYLGDGQDFDPSKPFRMYHSHTLIPGVSKQKFKKNIFYPQLRLRTLRTKVQYYMSI